MKSGSKEQRGGEGPSAESEVIATLVIAWDEDRCTGTWNWDLNRRFDAQQISLDTVLRMAHKLVTRLELKRLRDGYRGAQARQRRPRVPKAAS